MRIHHLNCGSMRPAGVKLITRIDTAMPSPHMVCHCLLVETNDALVLVDTGFGLADIARPEERLSKSMLKAMRPALLTHETAASQIESLGFSTRDVKHIILTHLDPDHAGGLSDFPHARVHVLAEEHQGATRRSSPKERLRYRPKQWDQSTRWQLYSQRGEAWFGFEAVRDLSGLPPEFLMVPMSGHSRGHAAIALAHSEGWLLHCGDAYFEPGDVHHGLACSSALTLFQRLIAHEHKHVLNNQRRLRELNADTNNKVSLFCSHDASELAHHQRAHSPPHHQR